MDKTERLNDNGLMITQSGLSDKTQIAKDDKCGDNVSAVPVQTVEEFKDLMYKMQAIRRKIVEAILNDNAILEEWFVILQDAFRSLTDSHTKEFERELSTINSHLNMNIKDETNGLKKDLIFLKALRQFEKEKENSKWSQILSKVDLISILAPYHPVSEQHFLKEFNETVQFLRTFVGCKEGDIKPVFITDWDGTMKDYCSQYATNLQPVYSAVGITRFASSFTRLSAVLTAGPLRGPGILDLTAMPIDGPVFFSGSWGREWWLGGKRIVNDDGISEEGFDALQRLNDEVKDLLHMNDFSLFALVGSGVQRKVDRLTLGVQTVCGQVKPELSNRYQNAVKERMHRVDPSSHILVFDSTTELEVEVVAHTSGKLWNKANGMDRVIDIRGESLTVPGRILVCGDTSSDLPMIRRAASGVMAILVGINEKLRQSVREIIRNEKNYCFVSCPDVIHAAMADLLKSVSG